MTKKMTSEPARKPTPKKPDSRAEHVDVLHARIAELEAQAFEYHEELMRRNAARDLLVVQYARLRQFVDEHYGVGVLAVFDSQR